MLRKMMILLLGVVLLGSGLVDKASASTGFSISVGTDDFYLSVGNYDYYPYTLPYYNRTPRISFHSVMGDYGSWVPMSPFGQVWRPFVRTGWRPYVNGHWIYTRYGPTWVGYEPWAWAGYHYGNWIWSARYGWVWIPGYDWHPGRVIWSHGYDTIGWMPAPPIGYDYARGQLNYRGSNREFDYYDDDFGYYDDEDDYYYGDDDYYDRDRYDSRYDNPFYGSGYRNIAVNLWIFIDVNHYRHHNYADYYLDADYTRALFDRRLVRISTRPIERRTLERIVKHRVQEAPVQEREIETNNRRVKVVVPVGEEENIRRNANRVVKNVIAPAFAEKRRNFKGLESENTKVVNKVFRQENRQPKIRKQSVEEVLREIDRDNVQVERQRKNMIREKTDQVIRKDEAAKNRGRQQRPEARPGTGNPRGRVEENRPRRDRDDELGPEPQRTPRDEEFESKRKSKNRDEQFDAQKNNNRKQEKPRRIEEREDSKPANRDEDFQYKQPKQRNRDEQFEQKPQKKQQPREFEPQRIPEREKKESYRVPRNEPDRNVEQENDSEKRRPSSKKKAEQVEEEVVEEEESEKTDKEKSKKNKKKDSKKKKQEDEPSR